MLSRSPNAGLTIILHTLCGSGFKLSSKSRANFLDKFESDTLKCCLDGDESNVNEVVVPMLSRFNCVTRPMINKFRELILKVARHALVNQSYFVLCEIKREMMDSHPDQFVQKISPRFTAQFEARSTESVGYDGRASIQRF